MKDKRIYLAVIILIIIILAVLGLRGKEQPNIQTKTSLILSSDVIAIVNNDQKVDYGDTTLNFGEEIVKQIQHADTKYNYEVTSSGSSMQGLSDGKYAAAITIPSNLTNSIVSINSAAPTQASIDYELNSSLPTSKSEDIENEIQNLLFGFESKLSYMYVYAIFDSLHTAQEGVETVTENQMPVYDFLEEVSEIDIVGNHEYELEENNTDSFENIDISEQMKILGEIISNYGTEIASVITIYKIENDQYNQQVNSQIDVFEQNTEEIINRIENVEDTLDTIVDSNEQYADEEYSVTGTKDDIENIMIKYYNQLSELNTVNADNQKLVADADQMKTTITDLKLTSVYNFVEKLLMQRQSYYQAVDAVNDCVQGYDESDANLCLRGKLDNFDEAYSDYENLIAEFKHEANYYKTLSYYVNHIGEDMTAGEEEEISTNSYDANITLSPQATSTIAEEEKQSPIVEITEYDNLLNNRLYFSVQVDNRIAKDSDLNLDYSLINAENIELVTNENNVSITNSQIKFSNLQPITTNYQFVVQSIDPNQETSIELSDGINKQTISNPASSYIIQTNVSEDNQLQLTYTYNGEENIVIESEAFTYVTDITTDNDDIISLEDTTLTITTDSLVPESIVTINLQLDTSSLDDGNYQFGYTINDEPGQGVYKVNNLVLNDEELDYNPEITISDDPYVESSGRLDDIDNDYESEDINGSADYINNKAIEPMEEVGIKVDLSFAKVNPNLDQLSFDLSSDVDVFESLQLAGIKLDSDYFVPADFSIDNGQVTISNLDYLSTDVVTIDEVDYHQFDISIYINAIAKDDFSDDFNDVDKDSDTYAYSSNISVNNQFIYDNEYAEDKFDLAFGEPQIADVTYQVDNDICSNSIRKLEECSFEGGETITRTITLTNTDNSNVASGLKLVEDLDTDLITYSGETTYEITTEKDKDISGAASLYIDDYKDNEETTSTGKSYYLTIPAASTVTITNTILVSEEITDDVKAEVTQGLSQFDAEETFSADQTLNLKPISLIVTEVSGEQIVDDGIITDDEALKLTFEIKNDSNRGTSHHQKIVINNSNDVIVDAEVMSLEDGDWYDVTPSVATGTNQYLIETNYDLKPSESLTYTVKYRFDEVPSDSSSQHLVVSTYKSNPSEAGDIAVNNNYEYYFSDKTYLELAQDQLANKDVVSGETYDQTLDSNTDTTEDLGIISQTLGNINTYVFNFIEYIKTIDSYTILDNDGISDIVSSLNEDGLLVEDENTEEPVFDYCTENSELSCKLYNLYSKIFNRELSATKHMNELLNTIDPSVDYKQSNKTDRDDQVTDEPTNIGADFNGYGNCKFDESQVTSETDDTDIEEQLEDCEKTEVGIWDRLDQQDEDIEVLKDDIETLIDNELNEVDEEPYQEQVSANNDSMNESMAEVETENDELFDEKIEIYNENYDRINDYIQEISDDKSYTKAISTFTKEENGRQVITMEILGNVIDLMPNTYLDGMPNRLIYSFIANPLAIEQLDTKQAEEVPEVVKQTRKLTIYVIIGLFILAAGLIGIYLYINREEY